MSALAPGVRGTYGRFAASFLGLLLSWSASVCAEEMSWKQEKGDHFIVYYVNDEAFAVETKKKAEVYYNRIADELGYARMSNFWQWENRVKILIYPSEKEYHEATKQPDWSKGVAYYDKKSIVTFQRSDNFIDGLLPHEITHLIFRDFVGFTGQVPLWMDEGVAQWQEPRKRELSKSMAKYLIENGKNLSIQEITSMDIRGSEDKEMVNAFYMQAVSLVDFLVKQYGAQSFSGFCRQLRDGKSLDEALRFSYPSSIRSLQDLENQWTKYVKAS
jgi:hypothetical protein